MKKRIALDVRTESWLEELAAAIKELPRTAGGKIRVVPKEIQIRVQRVIRKSGMSRDAVAKRIGITGTTIRGWSLRAEAGREKRKRTGVRRRRAGAGFFKKIELRPAPENSPISRGVVLELSGGAKVHGLSLTQLRELIGTGGGA